MPHKTMGCEVTLAMKRMTEDIGVLTRIEVPFVRNRYLTADDLVFQAECVFSEHYSCDGSRPFGQWEQIDKLPFIDVASAAL